MFAHKMAAARVVGMVKFERFGLFSHRPTLERPSGRKRKPYRCQFKGSHTNN